jgi:hypothetical protein
MTASAFRVLPEHRRFRVAVIAARWLAPIIRRTRGYAERAKLRTDSLRETSLELLLMMLTRHGTTFTPRLRVDGASHLPAPGTGPILVVSPHTMLSMVFLRHLEDEGLEPYVVAAYPHLRTPGTRSPARVLLPSPSLLFKVRRLFEEGRTVAAMIDRDRPERRSETMETSLGPLFVSAALLQLALRCRARIVFLATGCDGQSGIVSRLSSPRDRATLADVLADFRAFVAQAPD